VLLIGWNFLSTNQKHYQDLRSDTSSVWYFCARYAVVVFRGLKWRPVKRWLFSEAKYSSKVVFPRQPYFDRLFCSILNFPVLNETFQVYCGKFHYVKIVKWYLKKKHFYGKKLTCTFSSDFETMFTKHSLILRRRTFI